MLPLHSTYLLQPLDIVLFQPYKHFHAKAVDDATRTGCDNFNKVEFLAAISDIRKKTFKSNSIKSAFREYRLVPFNPQKVVNKLEENRVSSLSRPSTPEQNSTDLLPKTPLTIRSLEAQADLLKQATSPDRSVLQKKFIKGAILQATIGA